MDGIASDDQLVRTCTILSLTKCPQMSRYFELAE